MSEASFVSSENRKCILIPDGAVFMDDGERNLHRESKENFVW